MGGKSRSRLPDALWPLRLTTLLLLRHRPTSQAQSACVSSTAASFRKLSRCSSLHLRTGEGGRKEEGPAVAAHVDIHFAHLVREHCIARSHHAFVPAAARSCRRSASLRTRSPSSQATLSCRRWLVPSLRARSSSPGPPRRRSAARLPAPRPSRHLGCCYEGGPSAVSAHSFTTALKTQGVLTTDLNFLEMHQVCTAGACTHTRITHNAACPRSSLTTGLVALHSCTYAAIARGPVQTHGQIQPQHGRLQLPSNRRHGSTRRPGRLCARHRHGAA